VNCLVLDEPTNHLDLPAIEQLEAALDQFRGTLLIVSHDRALLDRVAVTRTLAVGSSGDGTWRSSGATVEERPHPHEEGAREAQGGHRPRRRGGSPAR
jgi:ATPase subunit of ABC transporter with duplicated ATPase domains